MKNLNPSQEHLENFPEKKLTKEEKENLHMKNDILEINSRMKSMGYSEDEDCETPIISRKENVFVVKDYVDGNKEFPCFKGNAFFGTGQINDPNPSCGENCYVLDFKSWRKYYEKMFNEDSQEELEEGFKKRRFEFISTEIQNIRDKDKIIGNIECSVEYTTKSRKKKKVYIIKFSPTKESVSETKTEEIFLIIEAFRERFEKKLNFTEALHKIKKFCNDKTLSDDEVKFLFINLKISSNNITNDKMLEYSKTIKELRPNIVLMVSDFL